MANQLASATSVHPQHHAGNPWIGGSVGTRTIRRGAVPTMQRSA